MPDKDTLDNGARRCSVFLTPAGDDFAYLAGVVGETCAKYDLPSFEPHVTLYSGMFPDPALLQRGVAAAVAGVPPVTLRVLGIGCSTEYFKTLFVQLEEHPILRSIHERVKGECGDVSPYELFPHLSLLYAELPLAEKEALAAGTLLDRSMLRFDEVKIVTPLNRVEGWRDTMQWRTLYRARLAESYIRG